MEQKPRPSSKKGVIKESTRQRCKIIPANEKNLALFRPISMELFTYLHELDSVEFSLYIQVESEIVEYIRPKEFTQEFLRSIWDAGLSGSHNIEVFVAKKEYSRFELAISTVRQQKIKRLLQQDSSLDPKTLEVFGDLSGASQMVQRGGLSRLVSERVRAAASNLVNLLMDNEYAIGTLSRMILIDPSLYDHCASVAMFATVIARQHLDKALTIADAELIAQCGLYHDVGKSGIPHAILNKPGFFTPEEFAVMKTHVDLGYKEITSAIKLGAPIEDIVAVVALEHHERMNGHGYPFGKKGRHEDNPAEGIHLFSRIVSIADVYSALLMKRVYKPALPATEALKIMAAAAASDFDLEIFEPFARATQRSLEMLDKLKASRAAERTGRIIILDEKGSLAEKLKLSK